MTSDNVEVIFRAMKEAPDGSPETGNSARKLGVRIQGPSVDIVPGKQGLVRPGTGGMSVAPDDPSCLPHHRRPRSLGGEGRDPVFAMTVAMLPASLYLRSDTPTHALVEPRRTCPYADYETALYSTRLTWRKTHD